MTPKKALDTDKLQCCPKLKNLKGYPV